MDLNFTIRNIVEDLTRSNAALVYNTRMILSPAHEDILRRYAQAVAGAPHSLALTATRDPEEFWNRHVLDALALAELVPENLRSQGLQVLDVGTGNGIPGIPIAVTHPQWQIYMIDSNNKKCGFLDTIINLYDINNATIVAARMEEFSHWDKRETFDIVFSRALAKLPVALELSAALIKLGGLLVVPHGTSSEEELQLASQAVALLGLKHRQSISYQPIKDLSFVALVFEKISLTPSKYPRPSGVPQKRPL